MDAHEKLDSLPETKKLIDNLCEIVKIDGQEFHKKQAPDCSSCLWSMFRGVFPPVCCARKLLDQKCEYQKEQK